MDAPFEGAFRGGHEAKRRSQRTERHPSPGLTRAQVLAEADKSFTYFGKPIHPALVQEFECWISDQNPVTRAVDVSAAYDTNEYCQSVTEDHLEVRYEEDDGDEGASKGYYSYRHLGRLSDGTHVVRTASYGGGSGVFESLLFIRFRLGRGFYQDGAPYDVLEMRLVRDYYLGDRSGGSVKLLGDRVEVSDPDGDMRAVLMSTGNR